MPQYAERYIDKLREVALLVNELGKKPQLRGRIYSHVQTSSLPRTPVSGAVLAMTENKRMLWIPPGFAHGFVVLSDTAEFLYKTTDYWAPEFERCILWNDAELAIDWKLGEATPVLSAKDAQGKAFAEAEMFT